MSHLSKVSLKYQAKISGMKAMRFSDPIKPCNGIQVSFVINNQILLKLGLKQILMLDEYSSRFWYSDSKIST